jgi:hypothetical protein
MRVYLDVRGKAKSCSETMQIDASFPFLDVSQDFERADFFLYLTLESLSSIIALLGSYLSSSKLYRRNPMMLKSS